MSDASIGGIHADVTADTSQFRRQIAAAGNSLSSLEPVVARQWWGLRNLSLAFVGIAGAVGAGVGAAVREAASWEEAMAGVERTTRQAGDSGPEAARKLKVIEEGLRAIARTTPMSAAGLASIAEEAGALGIEAADIPKFTKTIADLVATTDLTAEQATSSLARIAGIMGTPINQFDRLGSTILEVGRNTAATEPEITNLALRLAPVASQVGLTTSELIGLSGALASVLGKQSQRAASSVARTFNDMSQAIVEGGDKLDIWSKLTGKTADEFVRSFGSDAMGTLQSFINTLADLPKTQVDKYLTDLGITEIQQITALSALAQTTANAENRQATLAGAVDLAREAWAKNTAETDIAERRYRTAASQLAMLRNQFGEIGNTIGANFLGPLRIAANVVESFLAGIRLLPGWLQGTLVALVLLAGGVAFLAAAFLTILPRVVLARQVLNTLRAAKDENTAAATRTSIAEAELAANIANVGVRAITTAGEMALLGETITVNTAAMRFQNVETGKYVANTEVAAIVTQNLAAAETTATTAAQGLAVGIGTVSKVLGAIGLILTIATIATTAFGASHKKANEDVDKATTVNMELVNAIRNQSKALDDSATQWIIRELVMSGATETAERLHIKLSDLTRLVSGNIDPGLAKSLLAIMENADKAGDKGAGELRKKVVALYYEFKTAAEAAGVVTTATKEMGGADEDAADAASELADKTADATAELEKKNKAISDYVSALMDQQSAQFAAQDALDEYNKALKTDPQLKTAQAENALIRANNDHAKALRDLEEAEKAVSEARKNEQDELVDAQDALLDAQDRYQDSLAKITDAQDKLNKLRTGPTLKEITDATKKLTDAQRGLRNANQQVADGEWQLNYIRQQGGSARDIQDAENSLADARQAVVDQTNDKAEAEDNLNKVRQGANAEDLAAAERDLGGAYRDSEKAARAVLEAEENIRQVREDIASDKAFIEANEDLADAQGRVLDSQQKITDAQLELDRIRAGGLARDLAKAELEYEDALIRVATANAEVRKQDMLRRGEFVDAGVEARLLAEEIGKLTSLAPTPEARKRLQDYVNVLKTARPGTAPTEADTAGANRPPAVGGTGALDDVMPKLPDVDPKKVVDEKKNMLAAVAIALVASLLGLLAIVVFGVPTAVAAAIAAIIGILLWGVAKYGGKLGDVGKEIINGIWQGIQTGWDAFTDFFVNLWHGLVDWFKDFFGISSPSKLMADIGSDIINGIVDGVTAAAEAVWNFFKDMGQRILDFFLGAGNWLWDTGSDLIRGFGKGIDAAAEGIWNFFGDVGRRIGGFFSNAFDWIRDKGGDLIRGFAGGIDDAMSSVWDWFGKLGNRIWDTLGDLWTMFTGAGKNIINGLWHGVTSVWDGFVSWVHKAFQDSFVGKILNYLGVASPSKLFHSIGRSLIQGLQDGIKAQMGPLQGTLDNATKSIEAGLNPDLLRQFDMRNTREFALQTVSAPSVLGDGGGSTTTNNEGDVKVEAHTDADPDEIAHEIMWRKMIKKGG